jgi:ABC-type nitrate/sulfonate/bicarbonate transport system substrate-binding protein
MDDFAARHGVNPARVTFTPLGSIPNVLAALEAGRIDVGLLSTPFNLRAKADGLTSLGFAIGPPSPYVVNTGWAAKNGATITSWIEAFVQGTWAYYTDKKAAEAVLASFLGLNPAGPKDAATLSASFKNYLPPVSEPLGECSAANFAPYLRFFPAQEQARLRNLGRFIDNRYVTQLARSGFYARQQARYGPVPGLTLQQVIASQPPLAGTGRRAARS